MNETIENILSRRSIRKFTDEPIKDDDLDLIIKCGLYAANGGGHQIVKIVAIKNSNVLNELTHLVRNEFKNMKFVEGQYWNKAIKNANINANYDFRFNAPVVILAAAPDDWYNGMADSALVLANMQIAATSLKLGTCYVNQINWLSRILKNKPMKDFLTKYGIDEDYSIYGSLALGHPLVYPEAAPRKENRIIKII